MQIEDLELYNYDPPRFAGELAVGWLDGDPPIESTGRIEPKRARKLLIERLTFAAAYLQSTGESWMGAHSCTFCDGPATPLRADGRAIWGAGEFRVLGLDGTIYVAPTLIAHYVEAHDYLPPSEFIDAVFQNRFIEERIDDLPDTISVTGTAPATEELRELRPGVEIALLESAPWNDEPPRPMLGLLSDFGVFGPWDGTIEHASKVLAAKPLIFDTR